MSREAELLRVTLSSIGDGVITTDADGKVTFANPVAQSLTGWTQEQAIGRSLESVFLTVHQDTRARVENPALRALREGIIVGLANHTLLIASDGSEKSIDASAAPIKSEQGDIAGAVLVFRDITERKEAERALQLSEARKTAMFETALDCIITIDHQGLVVELNRAAERTFGYARGDAVGRELAQLIIPPAIREQHRRGLAHCLATGEGPVLNKRVEMPALRADGSELLVELAVARIAGADGPPMFTAYLRDITERVRMRLQLVEQADRIADESRRKDEFLAMLGHELRNPLAPIRSAVHLLRLRERGSEDLIAQQARDIIDRQVANLTKIVSDLLEVSRVVSGRIRLEVQVVDLGQVIQDAVETTTPLFEERKHKLIVHACPAVVWARADATRMEQVFVNLLTNAAKYTPDGGRIEVWCEPSNETNSVQVRVRDNGVGIPEEMLKDGRMFDLFTQADRSLARAAGGLGIGLSLAHRLVDMHGGSIEAHSPPEGANAGSEFIVKLPSMPMPPQVAVPEATHTPTCSPGLRILVVDDNLDQVMMLSTALRQSGYSVQSAYTGSEGLKVAQQWQPDVVLLDIGLPGMDGYEVARRIRADSAAGLKGAQLIALTGYGRDADVARAREAGFDAHLTKPASINDIEKMIAGFKR